MDTLPFTSLGFLMNSEDDRLSLAEQTLDNGSLIPANDGDYVCWQVGENIELWAGIDLDGRLLTLNPHFACTTRPKVALESRIPDENKSILDGSFTAWINGWLDEFDGVLKAEGEYPLRFMMPDYRCQDAFLFPTLARVQFNAFALEVMSLGDDDAFDAYLVMKGDQMASESFFPHYGKNSRDERKLAPFATFCGHVLQTRRIINPLTGVPFYWAEVRTYECMYDVLIDTSLLAAPPIIGGIITGDFKLSGRIIS